MSNNITVTTELCAEDRKRLNEIISLLLNLAQKHNPEQLKEACNAATAATLAQEPATPDAGHPVDEVSPHGAPEPVAEPEPAPVAKWTKDDLTKKVQALAAPGTGKREKVRDIVKSYAPNVGAIPEDKYDEVMAKLTALEKED